MLETAISSTREPTPPSLRTLVTGFRDREAVEFVFIYGDPDLSVELVLPLPAFREFCSENGCEIVAADDELRGRLSHVFGRLLPTTSLGAKETEPHA